METIDAEVLQQLRSRRRGVGIRIRADLRDRAMAFARCRVRSGASLNTIARELGIARETIRRWVTVSARRPMEPVALEVVTVQEPRSDSRVSVVSPSGYRVDGLALEQAAMLLRALA